MKVQGPRPENILFLIHEVIESLIAEFFFGVTYDFLLPCPDCIKRGVRDLFLYCSVQSCVGTSQNMQQNTHVIHTKNVVSLLSD